MLTCWMVTAGFLIALGIGGLIVEKTKVGAFIDHLTRDLPMNWARIEDFEKSRD